MGIKIVPHTSLQSRPCFLFPKLEENLGGSHFEELEKMKEAPTRVLDTLTLDDFHGAFTEWLQIVLQSENPSLKEMSFVLL